MRGLLIKFLQRILWQLEKIIARFSIVPDQPFFDPATFAWTGMLEQNWGVMRKELDSVMQYRNDLPNFQDISPDQKNLSKDDGWKTYFFYAYGIKAVKNCRRCPETTRPGQRRARRPHARRFSQGDRRCRAQAQRAARGERFPWERLSALVRT